jgi:hypothetical protein
MANEKSKSEQRRVASIKGEGKEGGEEETKKDDVKETVVATQVPKDPEETLVVPRKDLEGFMKRLNDLEETNRRLIAVADKGRLANERERAEKADGAPLIHTVRLTQLERNGQLVVAWKMTDNDSFVDGNRMVEKQNIQVVFKDGTTTNMRLVDFYRKQLKLVVAEIISRLVNEKTKKTELIVELKDGERVTIPLAFVN